ncbi:hypothetical protein GIB67_017178 [Kingdonia uniflora]|uniref:DNA ligase n=1 Tax=Kingdonia uniflora TaxID=39325 RepID=A0A7J7NKQ2_9MAGN|nr:hypothetical protein GIB67_017178 [Kingdonia uniflora]
MSPIKRNINDALMANARARAASSKKPQPSQPSPSKKLKPLENPQIPSSPNPKSNPLVSEPLESKPKASITDVLMKGSKKPSPSPSKKEKKDETPKLKSKGNVDECVGQLKRKESDFDLKAAAWWGEGERVPFRFLARAFDLIDKESGRIVITSILCNVFRTVIATTPEDLISIVYLAANKIAPSHEGIELGIGDASLIKAMSDSYCRQEKSIKNQLKALGDLGLVAKASRSQQMLRKPDELTVVKVLDTFRAIAKESGKDSQDKKRNHIKGLLIAAIDCEPQYLVRLLQVTTTLHFKKIKRVRHLDTQTHMSNTIFKTKLRIGLAEQTLLAALGQAAVYSEKHSTAPSHIQSPLEEAAKIIKEVYSVLPNYEKIITALLNDGVWKLPETCGFTLGVPVGPMLAKPTKGVSEILDKFQGTEFTCEYKYDGERAQIHYMEDGSVEIYSRNAERNTGKFPDVVMSVERFKKPNVKSFVLDCEVVGYDPEKQKILPFQILSTRARKGVIMSDITVKVCIFAFDILYLNGQSLLQEQLIDRREHLYNSFNEVDAEFKFATAIRSNDLEEIQRFLDTAVNSSCEGLIIKTLKKDATYEPSKRSLNWLKLKKDYMDSIGDSLDLVPIAAFHGRGKRAGVFGAFLLACYDENKEEYQSICKIGTGFSDIMLEERSASLRPKVIPKPKPYYQFADTIDPDVWFEPSEVWEVKAADLSISPVHRAAAGIVDQNKGISLRFPRLLRIREDKSPEQATSSDQVADSWDLDVSWKQPRMIKYQWKKPPARHYKINTDGSLANLGGFDAVTRI